MARPSLSRMFLDSYEYEALRDMITDVIKTSMQRMVSLTGDEEFIKSRMFAERERVLGLREILNRMESEMGKDNKDFALNRDFTITINI